MRYRADKEKNEFYPTPIEAVDLAIPLMDKTLSWWEPCAGDGRLIDHLEKHGGTCTQAYDVEPRNDRVIERDAMLLKQVNTPFFITNPPWDRKILHPLIEHLTSMAPTWLLFDADWIHTKQSIPYLPKLKKVVSIGRVKWIEGSKSVGKDNCCWYLFDDNDYGTNGKPIRFFGRT